MTWWPECSVSNGMSVTTACNRPFPVFSSEVGEARATFDVSFRVNRLGQMALPFGSPGASEGAAAGASELGMEEDDGPRVTGAFRPPTAQPGPCGTRWRRGVFSAGWLVLLPNRAHTADARHA